MGGDEDIVTPRSVVPRRETPLLLLSIVASTAVFASPGDWRDLLKTPGPRPAGGAPDSGPQPPAMQEGWDVAHYDIILALLPDEQNIQGDITARISARVDDPGSFLLHASDPIIETVWVQGVEASYTRSGDDVTVTMPDGLSAGDEVDVRITYHAPGTTNSSETGLHWGDPIYTFSEPEGARRWLVVFDAPADKATLAWHLTAPSDLVVVANGEPQGVEDNGDGTATSHFDFPWPIATYLMVVNAGDFEVWEDASGEVPVYTWASAADLSQAVKVFSDTPEMISHFSELWTPYAFGSYGNVLVPFGGAMEHTTATSYGEDLIWYGDYASIVNVHELGHHWWGDYVTCAEWEEIWLNEGFASYTEALWIEHAWGEDWAESYVWDEQRDSYLQWKDWEGEFALYDPDYMWGGTVYDKGSVVLHMLRFVVGDEAFFGGMALYAETHAHDVATTEDFRAAMESTYGSDLDWFFEQWVYRAGDPSYRVGITNTDLGSDGWQVDVHVEQTAWATWAMPVEWVLELEDGSTQEDIQWVESDDTVVSYCLDQAAVGIDFSPHAHLLYDELEVDLDGFDQPEIVCGAVPVDTGDTGDTADTGESGFPADTGPGDSGEDPEEPEGTCGCSATGTLVPSFLFLLGAMPWLTTRRR